MVRCGVVLWVSAMIMPSLSGVLALVACALGGRRTFFDDGVRCLLGGERALAGNGLGACDVELQHAELLDAFLVAKALLKAKAKELLGRGVLRAPSTLRRTEVANLFEFHDRSSCPA